MTRDEALGLGSGARLYHRTRRQGGGRDPLTVRVTGRVRTWKRDPERIEVPAKHGLRDYYTITEHDLGEWYASREDALRFGEVSAAIQEDFGIPPPSGGDEIILRVGDVEIAHTTEKRVSELLDLLVFDLTQDRYHAPDFLDRLVRTLRALGAGSEVDRILDRYERRLPPFRKSTGRYQR